MHCQNYQIAGTIDEAQIAKPASSPSSLREQHGKSMSAMWLWGSAGPCSLNYCRRREDQSVSAFRSGW